MVETRKTFKVNYFSIKSFMNDRKGTQRGKKAWKAKKHIALTRLFHLSTSSNKWKMKMLHHSNVPINVWSGKKILEEGKYCLRNDELSLVNFNTFKFIFFFYLKMRKQVKDERLESVKYFS